MKKTPSRRKKYRSGWIPEPQAPVDHSYDLQLDVSLQLGMETIDLRSNDIPIFDQENLSSCTANALTTAHQICQQQQGHKIFEPSRLFLHHNALSLISNIGVDNGVTISLAFSALEKYGVCPEEMWPYITAYAPDKPSENCYDDGVFHRAIKSKPLGQNVSALTSFLASKRPFVFGIYARESFESEEAIQTGVIPIPKKGEKILYEHAVVAVGFNPGFIIFQNCMGSGWGDQGYGYMPFDFIANPKNASNFWGLIEVNHPHDH